MRRSNQSCASCANFEPIENQCRAHAPLLHPIQGPKGQRANVSMWPATVRENWCGEWKADDPSG